METGQRKRSAYFTPLEIDILLSVYGEYEHIFSKKGNTAAAAKERELAWERIAARVNAWVETVLVNTILRCIYRRIFTHNFN